MTLPATPSTPTTTTPRSGTYRAEWRYENGNPAPGNDLGVVQPGKTATITRYLTNTGDMPLSEVQFTLQNDLPGLSVSVNDHPLEVGVMYTAPGLAPGEGVKVTYSRTVPADANPGLWNDFVLIRALT